MPSLASPSPDPSMMHILLSSSESRLFDKAGDQAQISNTQDDDVFATQPIEKNKIKSVSGRNVS